MKKLNRILALLIFVVMLVSVFATISVFADETTAESKPSETQEETVAETEKETTTNTETATETVEETQAESSSETTPAPKGVSDVSNVIGIIVASLVGVGAVVAIILLAPKKKSPKSKR